MFESLSQKLNTIFNKISSKGRISERDIEETLKEIRLALLEADVNFRVVREFIENIRVKAVGSDLLKSISPGQQVVKIVNDELVDILGSGSSKLINADKAPSILMLVGLQGSGKTTTSAKIANFLNKNGQKPLLVACDVHRPAAIDQLEVLGQKLGVTVYSQKDTDDPVNICRNAIKRAQNSDYSWVILDTAGRLHVDEEMMEELRLIRDCADPIETLLVVDSMTGQDAVNSAQSFHDLIGLTGVIMTKLDGDARGGAALSINKVTGTPIKFIGIGEGIDDIELFHPDRLASRILGMGDVVTLVERAQESISEERMKDMENKIRKATFDLEDFLEQIQQIKKMGPFSQILEMIPGFSSVSSKMSQQDINGDSIKSVEAIVYSMTPGERRNPDILNGSRRRRIALGSGTSAQQVNQLLNQFRQMKKMMKQISSGKMPGGMPGMFR
ncbi:MAG: signal recognition particle protein [SAR202 cluster bacterium]|nr:signal recognition particle protein [SAR202 cluster bacterium]|tara:strand:- start:2391 stop:3722 length:1332 start_codon:yes stop_codon:yes gene_type:complete